jgi:biopolymer transport protein ExbD
MSRKNPRPEEEAQAIDLTPMLDVVFIMLIFFIVTATFIKETAEDKPNASILIAIGPDNEIWMDKKEIDPRNVRQAIERMRADNPKGSVSIQADKESDLKFVVDVANAARKAGVTDISVSTEKN